MMLKRTLLATVIALSGLLAAPAHAGFLYNLSVTGPGSWTGSGSIELPALTGSSPPGASAFSFSVTSAIAGSPQNYGLSDIASIAWTIDSNTLDLTSLLLTTVLIPFGTAQSAIVLNNTGSAESSQCAHGQPLGSQTCETIPGGGLVHFGGVLTAELQTAVPEPAPLALMGLGWTGLILSRRRPRVAVHH